MSYSNRTACAPFALARLFDEPYERVCERLSQAGGDYRAPSWEALERVLTAHGIKCHHHFRRTPRFTRWRQGKPGYWVTVVSTPFSTGHCIVLKDGQALDNGWVNCWPHRVAQLRVHGAWQIERTKAAA
jgi:hypothetical protein